VQLPDLDFDSTIEPTKCLGKIALSMLMSLGF
jgi:hypothetical protein